MSSVTRPRREADFARFPSSTPIVIDNGASTFRIGYDVPRRAGDPPNPNPSEPPRISVTSWLPLCRWAGETEPRAAFRNVVQRPRHRSTGETVSIVGDTDPALMKFFDCTRSAVRSPFDDDVVYQFEYMEYILDYGFDRLGANSEVGHPILMTECECNPSFSRARMAELLFETYGVPSIAFGIDNVFSYKYNQKLGNCGEDGLAISCEHGTCHVVPPGMIGIDQAGIDEMVSISLRRLMEDESVKQRLCQSILVTGGSSLFPGMIPRLESGIRQYRPYLSPLKLVRAADPILDAWRGAAAFAASSKFGKQTFSLADYREHGENLFHRHNIVYTL
ncbi:Actin-related protein 5 [Dichanthelium oligosanthes]|uniref:Actin-related protein 5 n=1 Tax=Dichanthelium oligosanthes TaxID=888268 RepID=A0A1E5V1Z2_9POAL|nr:Actin-related protein 5 [Dichanthelium oligosanthes]